MLLTQTTTPLEKLQCLPVIAPPARLLAPRALEPSTVQAALRRLAAVAELGDRL